MVDKYNLSFPSNSPISVRKLFMCFFLSMIRWKILKIFHLRKTRRNIFVKLMVKNFFNWSMNSHRSFSIELVSIPNRHDAMLSKVYWPFNLTEQKILEDLSFSSTYNLQSQISCLSAYSSKRWLYRSLISFIKWNIWIYERDFDQFNGLKKTHCFQFCRWERRRDKISNIFPRLIFKDSKSMFEWSWSIINRLKSTSNVVTKWKNNRKSSSSILVDWQRYVNLWLKFVEEDRDRIPKETECHLRTIWIRWK